MLSILVLLELWFCWYAIPSVAAAARQPIRQTGNGSISQPIKSPHQLLPLCCYRCSSPHQTSRHTKAHGATVDLGLSSGTFGREPQRVDCPHCHSDVTTVVRYDMGLFGWLAAAGLCFFLWPFCCCFLPFCIDAFKDAKHYCPNCKELIGSKAIMG
jgi:lipopolysaccharide-induced tumor necrosis factor-alpha factor